MFQPVAIAINLEAGHDNKIMWVNASNHLTATWGRLRKKRFQKGASLRLVSHHAGLRQAGVTAWRTTDASWGVKKSLPIRERTLRDNNKGRVRRARGEPVNFIITGPIRCEAIKFEVQGMFNWDIFCAKIRSAGCQTLHVTQPGYWIVRYLDRPN